MHDSIPEPQTNRLSKIYKLLIKSFKDQLLHNKNRNRVTDRSRSLLEPHLNRAMVVCSPVVQSSKNYQVYYNIPLAPGYHCHQFVLRQEMMKQVWAKVASRNKTQQISDATNKFKADPVLKISTVFTFLVHNQATSHDKNYISLRSGIEFNGGMVRAMETASKINNKEN